MFNVSKAETDLLKVEKDSIDKWTKENEKKIHESAEESTNSVVEEVEETKDDPVNELLRANRSLSDESVGKDPLKHLNSLDDSIKISVKEEQHDSDSDITESDKCPDEDLPVYTFPKF